MSYAVDGKQYVAVTMGNSLHVFGLDTVTSTNQ
jgi:hypothetical protein